MGTRSTLVACLIASSSTAAPVSPAGRWQTIDDRTGKPRAIVRIEVVDGQLRGVIERILLGPDEGPDPICVRCPAELGGRRVVGMDILSGFRPTPDRAWTDGRILDPKTGKTFGGRLWLETPGGLKVKGSGLFGRAQTWHRKSGDGGSAVGVWDAYDEEARPTYQVAIREDGGRLHGAVLRVYVPPDEGDDPTCTRCPGERHGRKVIGMEIVRGNRLEGDKWKGGTVLDPQNGKDYRSSIWLEGEDTLRLRGYLGPFYRTQTWKRLPAAAPTLPPTP